MGTNALIIKEIHRAIARLGGSQRRMTADDACRIIRELGADVDLRSICGSWAEETLDDDEILTMLRNWNAPSIAGTIICTAISPSLVSATTTGSRIALGVDDASRADRLLLGVKGKRLTYRRIEQLLSEYGWRKPKTKKAKDDEG